MKTLGMIAAGVIVMVMLGYAINDYLSLPVVWKDSVGNCVYVEEFRNKSSIKHDCDDYGWLVKGMRYHTDYVDVNPRTVD